MEAQYHSMCLECVDWIEPGDSILPLEEGRWAHEECAKQ